VAITQTATSVTIAKQRIHQFQGRWYNQTEITAGDLAKLAAAGATALRVGRTPSLVATWTTSPTTTPPWGSAPATRWPCITRPLQGAGIHGCSTR
jgi:hypothetical protein